MFPRGSLPYHFSSYERYKYDAQVQFWFDKDLLSWKTIYLGHVCRRRSNLK